MVRLSRPCQSKSLNILVIAKLCQCPELSAKDILIVDHALNIQVEPIIAADRDEILDAPEANPLRYLIWPDRMRRSAGF